MSDEASKYHDVQVNEVFQIVAIGEEVEDGQMCPPCIRRPCPPCVLKTNYAVTCLWNIKSGVEYSCSTSPSYSKAKNFFDNIRKICKKIKIIHWGLSIRQGVWHFITQNGVKIANAKWA